jgi:hypothetical protein
MTIAAALCFGIAECLTLTPSLGRERSVINMNPHYCQLRRRTTMLPCVLIFVFWACLPLAAQYPYSSGCSGQPGSGQLGASITSLDKQTGQVDVTGGDNRQPTITPFTWLWGDGTSTEGWFSQSHTSSDPSRNYTLTIISHEDDGTTDCVELLIPFIVSIKAT